MPEHDIDRGDFLTYARFGYAHRLLHHLAEVESDDLESLRARSGDLSFSGHAQPGRVDSFVRTLRGFGLLELNQDQLRLTNLGRAYAGAAVHQDVVDLSDGQAKLLRDLVLTKATPFSRLVLFGLAVWATTRVKSDADFGDALARSGDFTQDWPAERTRLNRAKSTKGLLEDLRVIDPDGGVVTSEGRYLLEGRPSGDRWTDYLRLCRLVFEWDGLDHMERVYKLRIAEHLGKARLAFREGSPFEDQLLKGFRSNNNLVSWQLASDAREWLADERARPALAVVWDESIGTSDRVDGFLARIGDGLRPGLGGHLSIAAVLSMGLNAFENPPFRWQIARKYYEMAGQPTPLPESSGGVIYTHLLAFLDRMLSAAENEGWPMRDRLEAQSVAFALAVLKLDQEPVTRWSDEDRALLGHLREDVLESPVEEPEPPVTDGSLRELGRQLHLEPPEYLETVEWLLRDKPQIIFYGPPGTGKTFVAKRFAHHMTGGAAHRMRIVQFHPSYAYEDFVEGYRPVAAGEFRLTSGLLKQIAERAREHPDEIHVLLIDELNRGNVAKVFGELYFLLEYRDESLELQYSTDVFSLPQNLWLIGTMNTADRSIALMDAALRRRFNFVPFFPDDAPIKDLLRRWLASRDKPHLTWIADVVDEANRRLGDRDAGIGPSYFLRDDLTEEIIERIWQFSVRGYLSEQLIGQEDRMETEFSLATLRRSTRGTEGQDKIDEIETVADPYA